MKVATSFFAAAGLFWLGACATDEDAIPAAPASAATEMDPAIINPTEPSRDPLGTPPITPEDAK